MIYAKVSWVEVVVVSLTSSFLGTLKHVETEMSGEIGGMWSQGCSEEDEELLFPCQALPGCVVGAIVHQKTTTANELVIIPHLRRCAVCCPG